MKTHGYAARSAETPLSPFQFERRSPGELDVQIAIDHCGICHTDIHNARNEWGRSVYPCVPGHEIIGRVVATGAHVTKFAPGDRVGVGCFVGSCGTCRNCEQGCENYCERGVTLTYGGLEADEKTPTFGGYSTQIVVDEHFVLRVPDALDSAGAAPLLCGGITTYSPLKHVGLSNGDQIAVAGLGGLGHMAVKLAASFGAEVTVLSSSPSKRDDAMRLGAHDFVLTSTEGALDKQAGRFDYIIDTVSATHDINGPLNCLRTDGTLILVGVPPMPLELMVRSLIFGRRSVMGSLVGGLTETQEMLDYCATHGIMSDVETIAPDQINRAFERTLAGDVRFRFVIDCSAF